MITKYLQQILSARYGKDVRQSIHDGIKEIDSVARTAQNSATANAQTASAMASEALTASREALQKAQEAHESAECAKTYAENAEAVTGVEISTKDRAGIVKGGENHIAEDGTLELVVKTTETTMPNSRKGRVEVVEIGGKCEQFTTTGTQLLNIGEANKNTSGLAVNVKNNVITVKGTAEKDTFLYAMGGYATEEVLFVLGIGTYSLSDGIRLVNYNGTDRNYCNGTFTLAEPFDVTGLQIMNPQNGLGTFSTGDLFDFSINAMLNEGDKLLEFEPYTGGSPAPNPKYQQEVKESVFTGVRTHGKNLVRFSDGEDTKNGVAVKIENGVITLTGIPIVESGNILGIYAKLLDSNYFEDGVTYYASDCSLRIDMADGNKQYLTEFIFDKNVVAIQPYVQIKVSDYVNGMALYPMIATEPNAEFEPYKESSATLSKPIDLYGIGDVQDVIEDGKVNRKFEKYELTGTENIAEENSYFSIPLNKEAMNGSALCDIDSLARTTKNYARLQKYGMSLDEFKAYLTSRYESGNPAYFIYRLANESTEELPLADQIALNSLETYDGVTYMEFISEVQPTFKGNYGTSLVGGIALEGLLIARNNELRITALEA